MDDFDIDNVAFDMLETLGNDWSLDDDYGMNESDLRAMKSAEQSLKNHGATCEEFKDSLEDY